ncbi:hypothetical protein [Kitasatospora sp. LaBMicrA B282]|uniref:hypothetical protein n=1 Tax=Kitasatospora sp. LaBMicrA B282 TaxID=3420949 RepID=UPI003D11B54C
MDDRRILDRARWLLQEVHLTPTEAAGRLLDYFPDLEREERARVLREAAAELRPTR